jgi:copper(I)-binding protein
MNTTLTRRAALLAVAAAVAVAPLAACSKAGTKSDTADKADNAATSITVSDQWVKASPEGMTAMFGTLKNSGGQEATLVSASSPAAGKVELHEVVNSGGTSSMRPKEGGFAIPAGGTAVLAPGGDHIMLMDLKEPLKPGADVEVTLTFKDGSSLPVTAEVRDFSGAAETYQPGGHAGHNG